jgi:hypothetical protein
MSEANMSETKSTTALYDGDGEVRVGDVVHYGKKPCFIERWDGKFVTVTTMDEKKLMLRLWPKQLGLVVGSAESTEGAE